MQLVRRGKEDTIFSFVLQSVTAKTQHIHAHTNAQYKNAKADSNREQKQIEKV